MAQLALTGLLDRFPSGTTVGAYPQSNWATYQLPPSGSPVGSATTTANVTAAGAVTLTGLADDADYFITDSSGTKYVSSSTRVSHSGFEEAMGGDLTGTLPNPTIGAGKVDSSKILDGTIVDGDIAAANKDGTAGTPSLRTLGTAATQAAKGSDTEYAFSAWKKLRDFGGFALAGGTAGGTYLMRPNNADLLNGVNSGLDTFYIDPADFGAGGTRTTKFRLRLEVKTNAVAPNVTFTAGLYPVATWGGASGAVPLAVTLGAVVGATAAITTPGATSQSQVATTPGTLTAGWFAATVALSGATAANASVAMGAELQYQQV